MKKKILIALIIGAVISMIGCKNNERSINTHSKNVLNTTTVINKIGRLQGNEDYNDFDTGLVTFADQGMYVYYACSSNSGKQGLIKAVPLSNKSFNFKNLVNVNYGKTITEDYINSAKDINVIGNWIYFSTNIDSKDTICKIKKDGTEFTKIVQITNTTESLVFNQVYNVLQNMVVTPEHIIYSDKSPSGDNPFVHVCKLDGTEITAIKGAYNIYVDNNKIYYVEKNEGKYSFNALDLKTENITQFFSYNDDYSNTDMPNFISVNHAYYFIKDNTLYYTKQGDSKIYMKKLGNNDSKELTSDSVSKFILYNNKIYFVNSTNNNKLYSLDLQNNKQKKLSDDTCYRLIILENKLYYTVGIDNNDFKVINLK